MAESHFSCPSCGKRYPNSPALAGKSAKCACGVVFTVPALTNSPAPGEDDILAFADGPPVVSPAASRPHATAAPVKMASRAQATAAPLGYRHADADRPQTVDADVYIDRTRDYYLPLSVLVAGFVGILAWAIYSVDASAFTIAIVSTATVFSTAIKAAILIGLAIAIAPTLGISFGDLYTAILKFSAIIVFTDAASLWFYEIIGNIGYSRPGYISLRIIGLNLLISAALISAFCYYAFDMDGEETGMFAIPMAIISRAIGFVMLLVTAAILESITSGPAAAVPTAPAGAPIAAPVATPVIPATARDAEISDRISRQKLFVREAREHNERSIKPTQARLVELLYGAGAQSVYFDTGKKVAGPPLFMYIELPANPNVRTQIEDILKQSSITVTPDAVSPSQFVVAVLPPGK